MEQDVVFTVDGRPATSKEVSAAYLEITRAIHNKGIELASTSEECLKVGKSIKRDFAEINKQIFKQK